MNKILIIDDEINICLLLSKFLTRNGYETSIATSGTTAMEILSKERFHLILCDFRLEDTDGREILKAVKARYPSTAVIIITGYSDIKLAVELIKLGAYDYITKPLYPDEILNTINKVIEAQEVINKAENYSGNAQQAASHEKKRIEAPFIIGESVASRQLLKHIDLIAPTAYSVILTGESGTGKESVANAIHQKSNRRDKPFVAMDCGSLTKELAGSEFFGHEKGSFTGALFTKIGHFELANGGTLFLDEVANLSYEIQAALLRTVQERKIRRIGGTKEIELDVRIIVATNENLQQAIASGKFREDLYHRFNEFSIELPPLRKRDHDILLFADHFLATTNKELNRNLERFSEEAARCLISYKWPGNIRELKNVIRRAALLSETNIIEVEALPLEISGQENDAQAADGAQEQANEGRKNLKDAAHEAEYETILRVLKEVNYNKTKAAQILKIDRKTLYNKMKSGKML